MTNKLTVEQVDREAAADIWRDYVAKIGECLAEKGIRSGGVDDGSLVQTIARHRQQAEARAEGLVAALESIKWKSADRDNMEFSARITFCQMDAIRKALTAYRSARP